MTRQRHNLSFEELADEYRIFLLENGVAPREGAYDKAKQVLYVPRARGPPAAPGNIEVVSVRPGPEPPIGDVDLKHHPNPYGLRVYSQGGGLEAYVTGGRVWIDTDKREFETFESSPGPTYRPAMSGNDIEEVDLASGRIVGRVEASFYGTPGDGASGLLQFSGRDAGNCPRVQETSRPPLLAVGGEDPVVRKIRDHFGVGKIYIMPKEIMLV